MKPIKYYLSSLLMVAVGACSLSSCSEDSLGPTIFPDVNDTNDSSLSTYKFDKWLQQNYLQPYNLQFIYKMKDISTNMNYNVIPADFEKSVDVALLAKYLWFDVYTDPSIVGDSIHFLKSNSPRVIHLIGSPSYKSDGTILMGLAEGGVKISLYNINSLNVDDVESMNDLCFETMHHEFTHILHQKINYPSSFALISNGHYDDSKWGDRNAGEVRSLGFVTPYASSQVREDYAEVAAQYIVKTDAEWNRILNDAARGWEKEEGVTGKYFTYFYYKNNEALDANKQYAGLDEHTRFITPDSDTIMALCDAKTKVIKYTDNDFYMGKAPYTLAEDSVHYVDAKGRSVDAAGYLLASNGDRIRVPLRVLDIPDKDGVDGREAILKKLAIVRQWFADAWKIDLDKLHRAVIEREKTVNREKLKELRQAIENIQ